MMNQLLTLIVLAIVQGFSAIFPISRSGHYFLIQSFLGFPDIPYTYDVLLQLGTLLAILTIFRGQFLKLFQAFVHLPNFSKMLFQKGHLAIADAPNVWFLILVIISFSVSTLVQWFFTFVPKGILENSNLIALYFIATGVILFLTRRIKYSVDGSPQKKKLAEGKTISQLRLVDAFFIGLIQGSTFLPGLSGPGITIAFVLIRGCNRNLAVQLTFIISFFTIMSSFIFSAQSFSMQLDSPLTLVPMIIAPAFLIGIGSLKLLIKWTDKGRLGLFSYYCWGVSLLILITAYVF